ncbi:MAG: hypothetical protein JO191_10920 [Mycobacteriaceae bacterium]|nr:hypothetical protein [Mycobacteriaceae bacterium]MBV9516234.1 hypothetical protein [Mycobacteriaceae bacterium]
MRGAHRDIGPELRQLAQAIVDRLDPTVRAAAAVISGADSPGKCQQVWCPVCALAALIQGEQHPMLDVIGEHSVALLTVVRAMVDAGGAPAPPDGDGPRGPAPAGERRYQPIPITVDDR